MLIWLILIAVGIYAWRTVNSSRSDSSTMVLSEGNSVGYGKLDDVRVNVLVNDWKSIFPLRLDGTITVRNWPTPSISSKVLPLSSLYERDPESLTFSPISSYRGNTLKEYGVNFRLARHEGRLRLVVTIKRYA